MSRPNIVFVFADDWGWGDLSCYGHPHARTPNLDRLAAQGTLFSQFYVCSGVCSPSRAAVMTGRFPAHWGIHGHFAQHEQNAARGMPNFLDPDAVTVTGLLQQSGYAVGHFGKWHLGSGAGAPAPYDYGIDESKINVGNGPLLNFTDLQTGEGRSRSTEVIIDETIGFIERNKDEPFFVQAWLNDTHAILDPTEEQMEPYKQFTANGLEDKHKGALRIYYSVVTNADRHIGRLMDKLDELNLSDNTIVIFSADNGPEDIHIRNATHSGVGSSGPFRGRKRSLYEGGVRTPFIIRWPNGVSAGRIDNDTPLCAVDLLPTFCNLAGVDIDGLVLNGEDMTDALRGRSVIRKKPLMWEWRFNIAGHCLHKSPMLSVREGDWKLLLNPDRSRVELFNIPRDPMELNNRAEYMPERVAEMADRVLAWQDTLPEGPIDDSAGSNAYPWPGTF
ncbi:MAG: sulfatase-like hydrolase/transferase [Gemmatimonadetes bacterium]|nr:sulfatase-like hydrolase/transferase [Gemmatimonadota bacterium]